MKYLFRGKQINCNNWVFGFLVDCNLIKDISTSRIYEVNCNTIGLWTGCYDYDGMKIFENDIIKDTRDNEYYTIKFSIGSFVCIDKDNYEWNLDMILSSARTKVIGNTYEAE